MKESLQSSIRHWFIVNNEVDCSSSLSVIHHNICKPVGRDIQWNIFRLEMSLQMTAVRKRNKKYFSDSQEIPAMVLLWCIANTVFLVAVVSGMSVRLFLDPRKFMASIGKRIFSISMYYSLKLKVTLLRMVYVYILLIYF